MFVATSSSLENWLAWMKEIVVVAAVVVVGEEELGEVFAASCSGAGGWTVAIATCLDQGSRVKCKNNIKFEACTF